MSCSLENISMSSVASSRVHVHNIALLLHRERERERERRTHSDTHTHTAHLPPDQAVGFKDGRMAFQSDGVGVWFGRGEHGFGHGSERLGLLALLLLTQTVGTCSCEQ